MSRVRRASIIQGNAASLIGTETSSRAMGRMPEGTRWD